MHVLNQFVDQYKVHLAVEENRIKNLKLLIQNLKNVDRVADDRRNDVRETTISSTQ